MHISLRGFSKLWLLLLGACAARPIGAPPADASMGSTVEVAADLAAVATDLLASVADVAKQPCGNGTLDPGETCDDGNAVSGDGCSPDCQTVEPGWHCRMPGAACAPLCGDSMLKGSETCDDVDTLDGDGCSRYCLTEPGCSGPGVNIDGGLDTGCQQPYCGDGIVSSAEECDRGTLNADSDYGGCTTQCFAGPFCGDGMVNGEEACDLGVRNGLNLDRDLNLTSDGSGMVYCTAECAIPLR